MQNIINKYILNFKTIFLLIIVNIIIHSSYYLIIEKDFIFSIVIHIFNIYTIPCLIVSFLNIKKSTKSLTIGTLILTIAMTITTISINILLQLEGQGMLNYKILLEIYTSESILLIMLLIIKLIKTKK